mgnify:CR=1
MRSKASELNLTSVTQRHGSPHTLQISKPANWPWQGAAAWKAQRDTALLFVKRLADSKLLGPLGLADAVRAHLKIVDK